MGQTFSKKKTAPTPNINMTDASQVNQTLQAIAQSIQGMNTNLQQINASNVERDKILKELSEDKKQRSCLQLNLFINIIL